MASISVPLLLALLLLLTTSASASPDWSILNLFPGRTRTSGLKYDLRNYCESWRLNVELNNIRGFEAVPGECAAHVGRYMTSDQYRSDVQRAAEECNLYLTENFALRGDGRDAWIFDVDDTLLSTVPFYQKHQFGGEKINRTELDKWLAEGKAPKVEYALCLYKQIRARGIKVFLVSSRGEHLRDPTVDNLVSAGYHGWSGLFLRGVEDGDKSIGVYKADVRRKLVEEGYRIWGVVSSQWSALFGSPSPLRIVKLPNPMYYENY